MPYTKASNATASVLAFPWMGPKSTTSFILIVGYFYIPSKSRHEIHLLLASRLGRGPKSVSHQVVATLLRQLDFCTLVNRNLFANHYFKVPMFSVAHFFSMACQKYFYEAHFSLALRGGR